MVGLGVWLMDQAISTVVLCVGRSQEPRQQLWETRLEQAGLTVERVSNVYLALARVGRGFVDPTAILVWVDFLDPSEFEFFELVPRYHHRAAVYACGCSEAADKQKAALRAGAREVLTAERFETLLEDLRELPEELAGGSAGENSNEGPSTTCAAPMPEAAPQPIPEPSPEAVDELAAEEVTEETDTSRSARIRVPWRKSADGPTRTPPRREGRFSSQQPENESAAGAVENADPGAEDGAEVFDGPLLSPEELDLLMGDDVRTRSAQQDEAEEEAD